MGAKEDPGFWYDSNLQRVYVFGGYGNDANGSVRFMNDLWMFDNGTWSHLGGSFNSSDVGSYGTKGVSSSTNRPTPRDSVVSIIDSNGALWLFGGTNGSSSKELF